MARYVSNPDAGSTWHADFQADRQPTARRHNPSGRGLTLPQRSSRLAEKPGYPCQRMVSRSQALLTSSPDALPRAREGLVAAALGGRHRPALVTKARRTSNKPANHIREE